MLSQSLSLNNKNRIFQDKPEKQISYILKYDYS